MQIVHRVEDNTCVLELSVSDDGMKLFARIEPKPEHVLVTERSLTEKIKAIAPEDTVEQIVVQDIVKQLRLGKGCDGRRVACGYPPITGKDGKIVWLVRRFTPGKKEFAEGWKDKELTDFFTLGLFENIQAGREIARVYKPSLGTNGKDVRGKFITATPGKPVNVKLDKSVVLKPGQDSDGYDLLVAEIDGYVHEEGGTIAVRNVLTIQANLDYGMGHIDFIGSVKIGGDVNKGFNVKARGDIEIGGSLLGDNMVSSEGAIVVKGFHHGGRTSSVYAKGGYSVAVAQGVTTEVHGDIVIGREARDSILRTSRAVFAERATIVGGELWCASGAEIGTAGNEAGAKTVIQLRNELEVTEDYRILAANIKKHEAAKTALELHIGPLLNNRKRIPLLKEPFKSKIVQLLKKYDEVEKSLTNLLGKKKELHEAKQVGGDARINFVKSAFPGVELNSEEKMMRFMDPVQGPASFKFTIEKSEWESVEYKALEQEKKNGR